MHVGNIFTSQPTILYSYIKVQNIPPEFYLFVKVRNILLDTWQFYESHKYPTTRSTSLNKEEI